MGWDGVEWNTLGVRGRMKPEYSRHASCVCVCVLGELAGSIASLWRGEFYHAVELGFRILI